MKIGAEEVKNHPFFKNINWDTFLQNSTPPFVPSSTDNDPTCYFAETESESEYMEQDFGNLFDGEYNRKSADDQYDDFWCINVNNLKEKNFEIYNRTT